MSAFNHTITLLTSPLNENLGEVRSYNFKALSCLTYLRAGSATTPQHVISVVLQFQKIFTF